MRHHAEGLQALAYAYLRDSPEAEDVVQAAFLKAWERWRDLEKSERRERWMARTVRNECIDRWRRRQLERRYQTQAARLERVTCNSEHSTELVDEAEKARDLERAREVILALPEPYRSVLILRFIDKLSYNEIARSLGQPLGTVKTHLSRALKRVRQELLRKKDAEED